MNTTIKTMYVGDKKEIIADYNMDNIFSILSVMKSVKLHILLLKHRINDHEDSIELLEKILKYDWIKLPNHIIVIEEEKQKRSEMEDIVKKIYNRF